eukprot:TRINITY_DN9720_c0_g1_i4.p1 TRINITY_DN9720_c0_g1~~TRINITY_DN9720_c0_g1_i4.p1  ORF type:complete len:125 (-),score=24.90 TRINITY_DN9720_c0_g1_i4:78-452(-)
MRRRPPRSTQSRSSAASDVYKRQMWSRGFSFSLFLSLCIQNANNRQNDEVPPYLKIFVCKRNLLLFSLQNSAQFTQFIREIGNMKSDIDVGISVRLLQPLSYPCLLYTSPSPRDGLLSRMPSSA